MNSIAVCISGQIRNDDSALIQTKKALEGIGADVFFSVWRKRGTKTFSGASSIDHMARVFGARVSRAFPRNWIGRMQHVFPDSSLVFPSLGDVTADDIHRIFPKSIVDIEDENFNLDFPFSDSNSLRMLYKIWRCNRLKVSAEKARSKPYDVVVRMRPDITLDFAAIERLKPEPNALYTHANQGSQPGYIQDLYWIGDTVVDNKMANAFARAFVDDSRGWAGIHPELYAHTQSVRLEAKPVNLVVGGIHQFAQFDTEYSKRVQKNLLATVSARRLDVGAAGGEELCALAEKSITAAIDNTDEDEQTSSAFIEAVTRLGQEHPSLRRLAYTMGATYVTDNPDLPFATRLAFLAYWMQLDSQEKQGNTLDRTIGNLPEIFTGQEARFYTIMTSQFVPPDGFDVMVPESWKTVLVDQPTTEESINNTIRHLASNTRFLYWLLDWAEQGGGIAKVGELATLQYNFGVRDIGSLIRAARALRKLGNETKEFEMLVWADTMGSFLTVKARLGELLLKRQNIEAARTYLRAAANYQNCPKWANTLLAEIEANHPTTA